MARMMVEIDEQLLETAKQLSGARTKKQAIEIARLFSEVPSNSHFGLSLISKLLR